VCERFDHGVTNIVAASAQPPFDGAERTAKTLMPTER